MRKLLGFLIGSRGMVRLRQFGRTMKGGMNRIGKWAGANKLALTAGAVGGSAVASTVGAILSNVDDVAEGAFYSDANQAGIDPNSQYAEEQIYAHKFAKAKAALINISPASLEGRSDISNAKRITYAIQCFAEAMRSMSGEDNTGVAQAALQTYVNLTTAGLTTEEHGRADTIARTILTMKDDGIGNNEATQAMLHVLALDATGAPLRGV